VANEEVPCAIIVPGAAAIGDEGYEVLDGRYPSDGYYSELESVAETDEVDSPDYAIPAAAAKKKRLLVKPRAPQLLQTQLPPAVASPESLNLIHQQLPLLPPAVKPAPQRLRKQT
jgi:hypothetical protein